MATLQSRELAILMEAGRPMKVLLSFAGGAGHLNPCLPLVRALQTAGWLAAIGGQPRRHRRVPRI